MNNTDINRALIRLEKRADTVPDLHIRESFVEIGSLTDLLSTRNNQILLGRRGTGKTHTLRYLAELQRDSDDVAIYVDLRNVGSNSSVYADQSLQFSDRASRLLLDVAGLVHEELRRSVYGSLDDLGRMSRAEIPSALDALADSITQIRIDGPVTLESGKKVAEEVKTRRGAEAGLESASVGLARESGSSTSQSTESKISGMANYYVHFGSLRTALADVVRLLEPKSVWLLLDEWNSIPADLQPALADMLRRAFFGIGGVAVKISAVPAMSRFSEAGFDGSYVGIRLGADAFSDVDLDDYLVYDFDPARSTAFFESLIARHMLVELHDNSLPLAQNPLLVDERSVIAQAFTSDKAFGEFVKAAEGIPREGMGILAYAAQFAGAAPISKKHVRRAAKKWFETNKAPVLAERADADRLLSRIISEVAVKRETRGFLVDRREASESEVFRFIHSERFLHLVKMGISSPDSPGQRLDAFVLDYGCYVDRLEARKPLVQLSFFDEEENRVTLAEFADVPNVDYRTVRKAILRLGALDEPSLFP